jgi:uncharacterized protein (DUF885 family)
MIEARRRDLLGAFAASATIAAVPALAERNRDAELRAALDDLPGIGGYEARLARLAAFDRAALSPSAGIDLQAVRAALAIDAQLLRLVPGGKVDGPYRVPAGAEPGLWRNANGAAAYALLIERHVGARIDPETAHRRFEREAARLATRADRLLRDAGFTRGSVGARFQAIFADSRWLYPDDDAGRDAAVADMNRWLDGARGRLPALIGPLPPESLEVATRRMSRAEEAAGKGGYRAVPAPGKPGGYFVDLKEIRRRPRWSLQSVVHHELLPGHMVQLPIEAAAGPHPLRIAYLPAFSEGWAIHAEQLMADHGAYRGTPLDELGHLHWLLFRIVRALADTGIHHRRWTRAQARAELDRLQGVPAYFAPFDSDLDRIVAEPALRAAEALVWLGLADRVRGRTGAALRRANRQILAHGRKPLRLLAGTGRTA